MSIKTNIKQVVKDLQKIERNVPFALAKAINKTAAQVQKAEGENLGRKQVIRSDWWKGGKKFGINIKPFATKVKPTAIIGTQADWEERHEKGGTKQPKEGKTISIPTAQHRGQKERKITKAKSAQGVLKGKAFFATMRSGIRGIFRRKGRKRLPLKLLFVLSKSARIKKGLGFDEVGEATVNQNIASNFNDELRKAIK